MDNTIKIIVAIIPIVWMLVGIGALKWPTARVGVIALIITFFSSRYVFDMSYSNTFGATLEGFMLALFPIIWIIIGALFLYNISLKTKSIEYIKSSLTSISSDQRIQALLIAFCFGGFLEAVAGFGTAVAIPAGILISLGFDPIIAAAVCLLSNTVPVAFGVLGVPITSLAQAANMPLASISFYTALQLIPLTVVLPLFIIKVVTGSFKNVKGVVLPCFLSGLSFALVQLLVATTIGPEVAAVVASFVAMISVIVTARISNRKNKSEAEEKEPANKKETFKAWLPYLLIFLFVIITKLPFMSFLHEGVFVISKRFFMGEGGKPWSFNWITNAGTILFISAIIGAIVQKMSAKDMLKTLLETLKQTKSTIITVLSIVAVAKVMGYSGMVVTISTFLTSVTGNFYVFLAPLVGAIGTFITGSDTSSNVLFGGLQRQAAINLHANQACLVAANGSGATAGKMISPQSIAIASTTCHLEGKESTILKTTIKYCILYAIILGVIVAIMNAMI